MRRHSFAIFPVLFTLVWFLSDNRSLAQSADRIRAVIDDQSTATLSGNRHPLARREFETGPAPTDYRMERMVLVLETDPAQQRELEALIEAQHDPNSPEYHRWLTPESFAGRFGVSDGDVRQVAGWLSAHGFDVEEIPAGRRSIVFSGNAAQVESAFHTRIFTYAVGGELHHANATDPAIPDALTGVVSGVVTLHDFRRKAMHSGVQAAPEYTSGSSHYLTPGDFAMIYDVAPLYSSGIDGTGQTLAIVGRTNIQLSDVQTFRSLFGLPINNPTVVVNGTNPGIVSFGEVAEADLDVEWSGAVAPHAAVKFVVSASTSSTDGVDLSAQYIVSHNLASVMSTSFGSCEASMGASERAFYSNLWQQAAAQGITALIAAGDSGAAGCDAPSASSAKGGAAVNGLGSSVYSVTVGGSEFNDSGNPGLYWSAANSAAYTSALSYIPEVAWNESGSNGGSDLWAGGGGASAYYAKPSWQAGPGVPADGKRDVPDVSLTAAGHDGYLVDILGNVYIVSGTSAASPSFAGLMALVDQKTGARQGNANTVFYALGSLQAASGAHVFHDITAGNNSVPGQTGFSAGPHYDQATGLGSADAFVLVNHWNDATTQTPALTVTALPASVQVPQGSRGSVTVSTAISGGFSSAVALTVIGAPTGMTPAFAPASFSSPGSGASVLTIAVASSVAPGAYTLTITAAGGGQSKTVPLALTVTPPATFTLSAGPSSLTLAPGGSGPMQITANPLYGFTSAISLAAKPVPAGVSVQFAPAGISGGSGAATILIQTSSAVAAGNYTIVVTGTAPGLTSSPTVSVTLNVGRFTLALSTAAVTVSRGQNSGAVLRISVVNGFNSPLLLAASGLPKGVTALFSPASIANPASGTSTLTFAAASTAATGTQTVTLTATGGGASQSITVSLTVR